MCGFIMRVRDENAMLFFSLSFVRCCEMDWILILTLQILINRSESLLSFIKVHYTLYVRLNVSPKKYYSKLEFWFAFNSTDCIWIWLVIECQVNFSSSIIQFQQMAKWLINRRRTHIKNQ